MKHTASVLIAALCLSVLSPGEARSQSGPGRRVTGQVVHVADSKVTINIGSSNGLRKGMRGMTHRGALVTAIILVESVESDRSVCRIMEPIKTVQAGNGVMFTMTEVPVPPKPTAPPERPQPAPTPQKPASSGQAEYRDDEALARLLDGAMRIHYVSGARRGDMKYEVLSVDRVYERPPSSIPGRPRDVRLFHVLATLRKTPVSPTAQKQAGTEYVRLSFEYHRLKRSVQRSKEPVSKDSWKTQEDYQAAIAAYDRAMSARIVFPADRREREADPIPSYPILRARTIPIAPFFEAFVTEVESGKEFMPIRGAGAGALDWGQVRAEWNAKVFDGMPNTVTNGIGLYHFRAVTVRLKDAKTQRTFFQDGFWVDGLRSTPEYEEVIDGKILRFRVSVQVESSLRKGQVVNFYGRTFKVTRSLPKIASISVAMRVDPDGQAAKMQPAAQHGGDKDVSGDVDTSYRFQRFPRKRKADPYDDKLTATTYDDWLILLDGKTTCKWRPTGGANPRGSHYAVSFSFNPAYGNLGFAAFKVSKWGNRKYTRLVPASRRLRILVYPGSEAESTIKLPGYLEARASGINKGPYRGCKLVYLTIRDGLAFSEQYGPLLCRFVVEKADIDTQQRKPSQTDLRIRVTLKRIAADGEAQVTSKQAAPSTPGPPDPQQQARAKVLKSFEGNCFRAFLLKDSLIVEYHLPPVATDSLKIANEAAARYVAGVQFSDAVDWFEGQNDRQVGPTIPHRYGLAIQPVVVSGRSGGDTKKPGYRFGWVQLSLYGSRTDVLGSATFGLYPKSVGVPVAAGLRGRPTIKLATATTFSGPIVGAVLGPSPKTGEARRQEMLLAKELRKGTEIVWPVLRGPMRQSPATLRIAVVDTHGLPVTDATFAGNLRSAPRLMLRITVAKGK